MKKIRGAQGGVKIKGGVNFSNIFDTGKIVRPAAPLDVLAVKGILLSYSFLVFGNPGHLCKRETVVQGIFTMCGRGHGSGRKRYTG